MSQSRRLSPQTLKVLRALVEQPADWLYGLELARITSLKSGSLYPILLRLADRGLLESRWLEPEKPGRPPRHAYRITSAGRAALTAAQQPSGPLALRGAIQ
jgi:DNA-binding PadR family transcriptional regulator